MNARNAQAAPHQVGGRFSSRSPVCYNEPMIYLTEEMNSVVDVTPPGMAEDGWQWLVTVSASQELNRAGIIALFHEMVAQFNQSYATVTTATFDYQMYVLTFETKGRRTIFKIFLPEEC